MQFLAPPSALKISLLPDRQQSNVTRLCKVHRVQHVRSEAVMFSLEKKMDTEQETDKCQAETEMYPLVFTNSRRLSLLTLIVTVNIILLSH